MKINKILPFVDGIPEEFQSKIDWIRDGEPLNGASTQYGNDGELNRAPLKIQKNVETVHDNTLILADIAENLESDVENIKESLKIIGDDNAIAQVYINQADIKKLNDNDVIVSAKVTDIDKTLNTVKTDIGVYDKEKDNYYRTVRDNIVWVKKEMGAYPGQDINGFPSQTSIGSGMKYRIMNNTKSLIDQESRIKSLEDEFMDSDVGELSIKLEAVRKEIGPANLATGESIYLRLNAQESKLLASNLEVNKIKSNIDYSNPVSIKDRVTSVENKIYIADSDINSPETGILTRLGKLEDSIGSDSVTTSIKGRLLSVENDFDYMSNIVGKDSSSGIQGQIAWINNTIGIVDEEKAPEGSILFDIDNLKSSSDIQQSAIQDIQSELGNASEGIISDINHLNDSMFGNPDADNDIDKNGVYATVVDIASNRVDDADDQSTYVRRKGQWISKSVSVCKLVQLGASVDLSTGASQVKLGSMEKVFITGFRLINDEIVNDQDSTYRIEVKGVVSTENSSEKLKLVISINDTDLDYCSYNINSLSGNQVMIGNEIINLSANDRVSLKLVSTDSGSNKTIKLDHLNIVITPAT